MAELLADPNPVGFFLHAQPALFASEWAAQG
ncbi:protein of unknown function (plasmid) [Paraburkholderia dioscoreae]|uniref:Uncharacterized protein n=1 Tax=Paraburkholderia dioscoreae TaxID=2604047 RepID=A0A5Q4Z977_9BURK|nr:protein of unknown function [Paraburkholderia dioscoreae]